MQGILGSNPSASGGGFQRWIWLVAAVIIAIAVFASFCGTAKAQEQTTPTVQYLPGLFVGTQPGSHSFQDWFAVSNIGTTTQIVPVSFFGGDGLPVALAFSESQTGSGTAQSIWNFSIAAGETRKFYVVSNPSPLLLFWAKISNPAPTTIAVFGRYQLFGPTGSGDPRGFAFFQPNAITNLGWTFSALELGPKAGFSQRVVPIFVGNPNMGTASCTTTLKNAVGNQIGTVLSFGVVPNGQFFVIIDSSTPQELAKVEIVCNQAVVAVATPFLSDQFTVQTPQAGVSQPAQPFVVVDGRFIGSTDSGLTTPTGTSADFVLDVQGNRVIYFRVSDLKMNCGGVQKTLSFNVVGGDSQVNPLPLVDGQYNNTGSCGNTSIRFFNQTIGSLSRVMGITSSCWPPPYADCPTVNLSVQLRRQ